MSQEEKVNGTINSHEINCDFCGSKINTSTDKVCPNCGAPYDKDAEWLEIKWTDRLNNKESAISKKKIVPAKQKKQLFGKGGIMRPVLAVCAIVLTLVIIVTKVNSGSRFKNDDNYALKQISENNLHLSTVENGTIIDNEGVEVELTGIYRDNSNSYNDICVFKYDIRNERPEDVKISMELNGIDGVSGYYDYMYYDVPKNTSTEKYEYVYGLNYDILELVFGDIEITGKDYNEVYSSKQPVFVYVSGKHKDENPKVPSGKLIYDKNDVKIYDCGLFDGEFRLYTVNGSSYDYLCSSTKVRVNGKESAFECIYDKLIPAGYVSEDIIYSYYQKEFHDNDVIDLSLSFKCETDPSVNFSTGYLVLAE